MSISAGKRPIHVGALARRRLLEHLNLLCSSGAGLEAIAARACAVIRDYVPASSAALFWKGDDGEATGFYHDCAPPELKDMFVTRFEELFSSPDEPNMMSMTETDGPSIGNLASPEGEAAFHRCNVYRYLCVPLGHHHVLDVRIDKAGKGVAGLFLFNHRGNPFRNAQLEAASQVQSLLAKAANERRSNVRWHSVGHRNTHFVTDGSGMQLQAISADAEALLMRGQLLRQNVPVMGEMRMAPAFARQLAAQLADSDSAKIYLPVADGRLLATATPIRVVDASGEALMSVSLDIQVPADVLIADSVAAMPLTYLQKSILLFGMLGGARRDCETRFSTSEEALKKHGRAILQVSGASGWAELRQFGQALVEKRLASLSDADAQAALAVN